MAISAEDKSNATPGSRSADIELLAAKIKGVHIAMLTTVDAEGVMQARPMATQEADFDGQLWFFTKDKSGKVEAIKNDQHVNLSYVNNDKHCWISVAGRAKLVRDKQKMKELWNPLYKAWFPEGLEDPDIALLSVEVETAQIWDAPGGKLIMLASFAKSLLTGKTIDHDKYTKTIDLKH